MAEDEAYNDVSESVAGFRTFNPNTQRHAHKVFMTGIPYKTKFLIFLCGVRLLKTNQVSLGFPNEADIIPPMASREELQFIVSMTQSIGTGHVSMPHAVPSWWISGYTNEEQALSRANRVGLKRMTTTYSFQTQNSDMKGLCTTSITVNR